MGSLPVMIWDGGWEWGAVETTGAEGYWGGQLSPADLGASSWWRLSETSSTYADTIAGLSATNNGTTTRGYQGAFYPFDTNAAVDLDGTSGYVSVSDVYDFTGTAAFSVSCWINADVVGGRVISKEGTDGWRLFLYGTGVIFDRHNAGGTDSASNSATIGTGTWYHLVGTYDGSNLVAYVNGVAGSSTASSRSLGGNSNSLAFGRQANGAASFFNGRMDEVAIWSRALSADEVLQLYQYSAGTSTTATAKPKCWVAFNGKLATNFRSGNWRSGRQDWFSTLQPNTASLTFVGSVEAVPRDTVVISTDTGVLWNGYVDTVNTDQTLDGLYITTVTCYDVIGVMGRSATNRIDTWTWSGMTLRTLVPYVCTLSGLSGITVSTADSATALPILDGSTVVSGKTALEVISLAERSSNAILYVKRDGSLSAVVRDAIVASTVTTISLSGDNAPNGWSKSKGTTNVVNRWRLVPPSGTAVLDEKNTASIALYGEAVYEVTDYLDSDYPQFPSGMRTAMATPRDVVTSGTFAVTSLRQDILLLEPLSWVTYEGDTWQVMSVQHDASASGWTVTITADVSQNAMAGSADPTPTDPPSTLTTSTATYTSTKSATVFEGGGGNGAGDYLPVGLYSGYKHRALIDFDVVWPANFDSVKKATLTLTTSGQAWVAFGSSPKFYVRKVTESWSEGTFNAAAPSQYSSGNAVNWSNQPNSTATNAVLKSISTSTNNEITVDITDIAQAWHDDGVVRGVKLISNNEGSTTNTIEFWSDDAGTSSKRPKLTITCYVTS